MLQVKNASKNFGIHNVFNAVSFSVFPHEIVGLAGASGSGKSTLLRCLQGFERLDHGSIHFDGRSGFMFQDFQLFPHMTVLNNLIYAPNLKDGKEHKEEAFSLLKQLGIADKAHVLPARLSGGQKQRVALARSLMMKPSLLLCDEPTSGLDLASIEDVIVLLNTVKALGVSMVIASHDLNFLSQLSDRVLIIGNGKLLADLQPKQLEKPIEELRQYYQEKNHD
ncbi:ATP-binding cassette domain-containing protein [Legionella jordanis]|uniref:ABC transporter ATP-binding protein n=1 Tax=Legionella jordanis TaxID=456 RepID=A0A0W0VER6_9GAMM|nr:ATP-binding cassette domain-containing protein [Legionella jordanis]KTD18636.1 ABC transporter ATP-binding protein [Legionella jordanis]RMX00854.1 amino acid ABC transporter ATP-binding protein [Legionella jordanis]VEH11512.1 ABC transporter ATP-binding protein [Legionella jordanis]